MNRPPPGAFVVGKQLWARCQHCGALVRLNKPIFGSLHICLSEKERRAKKAQDYYREL